MARKSPWSSKLSGWSTRRNTLISRRTRRKKSGIWRSIVRFPRSSFVVSRTSSIQSPLSVLIPPTPSISHPTIPGLLLTFLITANGRIPAIIDRTETADGKSHEKRVFEGMAIMLYLCQKYDREYVISYAFDSDKWVFPLSPFIFSPSLVVGSVEMWWGCSRVEILKSWIWMRKEACNGAWLRLDVELLET